MTFTASDVLLKAASRIEEEGMWCQGSYFVWPDGAKENHTPVRTAFILQRRGHRLPACAMGTLAAVAVELGGDQASQKLFEDAHVRLTYSVGRFIPHWNDAPGRTAFEVADAMRKAAS